MEEKPKHSTHIDDEGHEENTSQKKEISLKKASQALDIPEAELKQLSDSIQDKIVEVAIRKESFFAGPLPPPIIVEKYEEILPGSFDRILKMAEENAKHRIQLDQHEIELEKKMVPKSLEIQKSGQNKAYSISIFGILAVILCAYLDQPAVAISLAGITLISLVPNFIAGIKKNNAEKNKNDDDFQEESDD